MMHMRLIGMVAGGAIVAASGCTSLVTSGEQPTGLSADVAAKAAEVADLVGGPAGFGGTLMDGYIEHMADHMGFHGAAYLADAGAEVGFELVNESDLPCTFHIAYLQSSEGLEAQLEDVVVQPGEREELELPCAEILGVGSLDEVGAVAAALEDGAAFDNRMCVPGFLNSDYACGGTYTCTLGPDTDDLDQDGDTDELIVYTSAMRGHLGTGGMMPHMGGGDAGFGGMMNNLGGPMMGGFRPYMSP